MQRGRGDIIRRREHVRGTCEATRGDLRVKEVGNRGRTSADEENTEGKEKHRRGKRTGVGGR